MRKVEHAPEQLARAQYLYERTTAPVNDIAAMLGVSKTNFYKRAREHKWRRRRAAKRAFEFARALMDAHDQPATLAPATGEPAVRAEDLAARKLALAEHRTAVSVQLVAATERLIDANVKIIGALGPDTRDEAERAARTLNEVARTLAEAAGLLMPEREQKADDEAEDDAVPRDIDAFREALAERIESFVAAQQRAASGAGEGVDEHPAAG